jgi:hypothetical protein
MSTHTEPVPPGRPARPRAQLLRRGASVLTTALLLAAAAMSPARAHYVQPPGDLEAAAAVVQVEIVFNYAVSLPGDAGERKPYVARVPGPRGTGAVVNSAGTVLTGHATVFTEPSEREVIVAINEAFRARHSLPWKDEQLSRRQELGSADTNAALQKCYARPASCADFRGRIRTVIFNTEPTRRLNSRPFLINDDLAVLTTPSDRNRTPTVGISATAPQDEVAYKAMGWSDAGAMLAPLEVRFEGGRLRTADLDKVASTFANGGDGVVVVDPRSKGNVVSTLRRGSDGELASVAPMGPLQFGGVGVDRGPLHPSIDEAIGYFWGRHYTHALPLLEGVVKLVPDRGLLQMIATAKAKRNTLEDKSNDPAASMTPDAGGLPWPLLAMIFAVLVVVSVGALTWSRRRRQRRAVESDASAGWDQDADDDLELEELMEDQSVSTGSEQYHALEGDHPDGARAERAEPLQPMAATTVKAPGAARPSGAYCSQCGVGLTAGDRFCYHCGNPAR